MRRRTAILGLLLALAIATPVSAHTPAAGHQRRYSADLQSLPYKFDSSVPTGHWLRTAYNTALQTQWATNNNSKSPRFSYSASGAGTVYFSTMATCFGVTGWLGCYSNGGYSNWNIWIRNGGYTYCEVSNVNGCFMAKRAILHEAEHVTLTSSHDLQSATLTNMGSCSPAPCAKPNVGYDSSSPRECDEAALQLRYDLYNFGGTYGDCLDHVSGAGSGGLLTGTTLTQTSATTCAGMSVSISGRLAVSTNTSYLYLSNNPLSLRTVWFDRKLQSSGTWTVDWSSTATSGATSGNNWTKSFSESPGGTTTYNYRAHYKGQTPDALNPSYSTTITITFLNPCPPP